MARVLVCDDDRAIRELLVMTLELDHEVRSAVDGRDLLAELSRDPEVDIILCDVMMPEMDGLAALRAVRGHPDLADVAFVIVSARAAESDRIAALEAGADAFVSKPFDPDDLDATIARLLASDVEERRRRRAR